MSDGTAFSLLSVSGLIATEGSVATVIGVNLSARNFFLEPVIFQPPIGSIGLQFSRFDTIVQKTRKHLVDDLIAQCRVFDGERQFNAPEKISRHPIRAGKKHSGLAGILKIKNPAVL